MKRCEISVFEIAKSRYLQGCEIIRFLSRFNSSIETWFWKDAKSQFLKLRNLGICKHAKSSHQVRISNISSISHQVKISNNISSSQNQQYYLGLWNIAKSRFVKHDSEIWNLSRAIKIFHLQVIEICRSEIEISHQVKISNISSSQNQQYYLGLWNIAKSRFVKHCKISVCET